MSIILFFVGWIVLFVGLALLRFIDHRDSIKHNLYVALGIGCYLTGAALCVLHLFQDTAFYDTISIRQLNGQYVITNEAMMEIVPERVQVFESAIEPFYDIETGTLYVPAGSVVQ